MFVNRKLFKLFYYIYLFLNLKKVERKTPFFGNFFGKSKNGQIFVQKWILQNKSQKNVKTCPLRLTSKKKYLLVKKYETIKKNCIWI